jgi:hypothetical protein
MKNIVVLLLILFFGMLLILGNIKIYEGGPGSPGTPASATTATTPASAPASAPATAPAPAPAAATTPAAPTSAPASSPVPVFLPQVSNVTAQTYIMQVFYYITPGKSANSLPIAYIYHNLPASFSVYFTPSETTHNLFIQNKNIKNNGDASNLIPLNIVGSVASSNAVSTSDSKTRFLTWYQNQNWSNIQSISGLSTVQQPAPNTTSITANCIKSVPSASPPSPSLLQDPSKTSTVSFSASKTGDTIFFPITYGQLSTSPISQAGTADGPYCMNLVNIYVTFPASICN